MLEVADVVAVWDELADVVVVDALLDVVDDVAEAEEEEEDEEVVVVIVAVALDEEEDEDEEERVLQTNSDEVLRLDHAAPSGFCTL